MIRINLIPVKKKKKRPKPVPNYIVGGTIFTVVVIIVAVFITYNIRAEITSLKNTKARNEQRLAELRKKLKELKNYERLVEDVKKKKEIIIQLRKNQAIPVKVLDELSRKLPDSVWFKRLEVKGKKVVIEGLAFTNTDIVMFVDKLKRSDVFSSVFLVESKRQQIAEKELREKITVYNFKLSLVIAG
jgi:type IV pilus assembly protein PilN